MHTLLQFHENPAVIGWWTTRLGGMLRWLTPGRRRALLVLLALWVLIRQPIRHMAAKADHLPLPQDGHGMALVIVVLIFLSWLCHQAACAYSSLPTVVRRHPQLTLHLAYWGMLGLLWAGLWSGSLWHGVLMGVALYFPLLIWRFGYLLMSAQQGRLPGSSITDRLLTLWPIAGGSATPYAKGVNFLARHEAGSPEELARSQLAGLRLLMLAMAWSLLIEAMNTVVYPSQGTSPYTLGIPHLGQLVARHVAVPLWVAWASVYCELVYQVLKHAAQGHALIAVLRLFGFYIFRNTYKPLLAESVSEFWNRYYYYFKELLANFFFFPVFMRLGTRLRNRPNLRLFLAVFSAAFLGNAYFHLLEKDSLLLQGRILDALAEHQSRMFYCLLLATGIFVSMLREKQRSQPATSPAPARRLLRIAGVWTFFGLIFIWNVKGGAPFQARVNFFLSLFGLPGLL